MWWLLVVIFGISSQTLEVAHMIKHLNPNNKILLGGPEVSYDYADIISKDEVDYIILGEGETPFAEFLNSYPHLEKVPSLVYKSKEKVIENPMSMMFDLENYTNFQPIYC
jgi:anaerobic magnesium-protoporphyrin IX monomethyl ester cyclase